MFSDSSPMIFNIDCYGNVPTKFIILSTLISKVEVFVIFCSLNQLAL